MFSLTFYRVIDLQILITCRSLSMKEVLSLEEVSTHCVNALLITHFIG